MIRKRKGKDAAIVLRFTIDRAHRFALVTGENINPKYWDDNLQRVKGTHDESYLFNQVLDRLRADVIQLYRDNKTKSIKELQEMARNLVKFGSTEAAQKKSLFPVLKQFIEIWKKEKDPKTVKPFITLQDKLSVFNPNLEINKLDNRFYDKFKQALFDEGKLDSTVYKYITNLCTFLTWAYSRGYEVHMTKENPTHKSWEIIRRVNEPIALTMGELEKLEHLEITEALIMEKLPPAKHGRRGDRSVTALTIARDYLIVECRTGQRISDIKSFDPKDMVGMVWVNKVTKGRRMLGKVNRVPFNTKFTAPAYAILLKYDHELPRISEQTLNDNIKSVCRLAGITQDYTVVKWKQNQEVIISKSKCDFLSTHTGKKTFITIGLQFMKAKLVKDLAGVSWKTLKHYEGQSEDQVLIDGLNSIPSNTLMKVS